jgi:hypothetical protein
MASTLGIRRLISRSFLVPNTLPNRALINQFSSPGTLIPVSLEPSILDASTVWVTHAARCSPLPPRTVCEPCV